METNTAPPAAAAAPASEAPIQTEAAQTSQATTTTTTSTAENAETQKSPEKANGETVIPGSALTQPTPMSKNQQKKMKRKQKWEESRDDRKRVRKERRQVKQAVRRAKKAEAGEGEGEGAGEGESEGRPKQHTLVPVSLIFDCAFEHLMTENELISMSSQVTRSYASNRAATNATRIYVSSWGGKMRTRYETLLMSQHKRWQNVFFLEDDFQEAARQASAAMRGDKGGEVVGALQQALESKTEKNETKEAADDYKQADLVYLTSDSPHTLTHLEPYTSYVIGGIVDRNREKGLCYRRAEERGIRTAKLPIGEYMVMASRQVLTTNQVVEIMLAWLETGDWATAFEKTIPKRKGGQLKKGGSAGEGGVEGGQGGAEVEEVEEEGEEDEADEVNDAEDADTPMDEVKDDEPAASA